MCVPDLEYLVATADTDECGSIPEPVRKRGSDSDRGTRDSGDGGEYGGGDFVL